jgi:hypothetical protein
VIRPSWGRRSTWRTLACQRTRSGGGRRRSPGTIRTTGTRLRSTRLGCGGHLLVLSAGSSPSRSRPATAPVVEVGVEDGEQHRPDEAEPVDGQVPEPPPDMTAPARPAATGRWACRAGPVTRSRSRSAGRAARGRTGTSGLGAPGKDLAGPGTDRAAGGPEDDKGGHRRAEGAGNQQRLAAPRAGSPAARPGCRRG